MLIHVILAGPLSRYGNGCRELSVEGEKGWQVADLISHLKIPEMSYSFVSIGGRKVEEHRPLSEGDVVTVFPPVSGG
ncbi:MoaD/ThiS family protein [Anoxynatronum sibiricum]|uniref:MoaD/ThiS family protein n=1 Tax=Anoxynatronum sibiricum TaxID=210623 RepID=A0ABU9VXS3_9CLOT